MNPNVQGLEPGPKRARMQPQANAPRTSPPSLYFTSPMVDRPMRPGIIKLALKLENVGVGVETWAYRIVVRAQNGGDSLIIKESTTVLPEDILEIHQQGLYLAEAFVIDRARGQEIVTTINAARLRFSVAGEDVWFDDIHDRIQITNTCYELLLQMEAKERQANLARGTMQPVDPTSSILHALRTACKVFLRDAIRGICALEQREQLAVLNAPNFFSKSSPLHIAAAIPDSDVVTILASEEGMDLLAKNGRGNTAAHCAAIEAVQRLQSGNTQPYREIIEKLMACKPRLAEIPNREGRRVADILVSMQALSSFDGPEPTSYDGQQFRLLAGVEMGQNGAHTSGLLRRDAVAALSHHASGPLFPLLAPVAGLSGSSSGLLQQAGINQAAALDLVLARTSVDELASTGGASPGTPLGTCQNYERDDMQSQAMPDGGSMTAGAGSRRKNLTTEYYISGDRVREESNNEFQMAPPSCSKDSQTNVRCMVVELYKNINQGSHPVTGPGMMLMERRGGRTVPVLIGGNQPQLYEIAAEIRLQLLPEEFRSAVAQLSAEEKLIVRGELLVQPPEDAPPGSTWLSVSSSSKGSDPLLMGRSERGVRGSAFQPHPCIAKLLPSGTICAIFTFSVNALSSHHGNRLFRIMLWLDFSNVTLNSASCPAIAQQLSILSRTYIWGVSPAFRAIARVPQGLSFVESGYGSPESTSGSYASRCSKRPTDMSPSQMQTTLQPSGRLLVDSGAGSPLQQSLSPSNYVAKDF